MGFAMFRSLISAFLITSALTAAPAVAEVPRVAVDFAPLHSLTARVMDGVGTPDLIMPVGVSPHGYAMRPSEAAAIESADLLIWVGAELTPWLASAIDRLAPGAEVLSVLDVEETLRLERRTGATFEQHSHDDEDGHHDEHADGDHGAHEEHDAHEDHAEHDDHDEHAAMDDHDEHDDHGHDDHEHDDHAHDEDGHDDHDHGASDPHAWLDPVNAQIWMGAIAEELASLDPENADTYRANAQAGVAELDGLIAEVSAQMAPLADRSFIVFHDAYQYFEARFGLAAAGSISVSDASDPSPARVAEIRALVQSENVDCAYAEPQFNRGLIDAVFEDAGANVGVVDPVGVGLEPGPEFYPALIRGLADGFAACF